MPAPIALCLEQTLGHRTHGLNLEAAAAGDGYIRAIRVAPSANRARLPWAIRASLAARHDLRASNQMFAATLYHTQSVSLTPPVAAGRSVISVDATPVQFDRVGSWYGHRPAAGPIEAMKRLLYRRRFTEASGLVAWSKWARDSLVADYGVERERVLVAHPGAGPAFFAVPCSQHVRRPTILFVGGDFERKGGPQLLQAWGSLCSRAELTLVTNTRMAPRPGLTVYNDIAPGDPRIVELYANADIFCLPTFGDCTPVVFAEAMAAGVPVVASDVGSNSEVVVPGETGFTVPPGDVDRLTTVLRRLVDDPVLRLRMGRAGRVRANEMMDALRNAEAVLRFVRDAA